LENRVPCVPVRNFDEVLADPQLNSRDFFQTVDHQEAGPLSYPGAPYRLSATPCRITRSAPALGQHNGEVLCGELGVDPSDLPEMARAEII